MTLLVAEQTYVNPVLDAGERADHGDPFVLEFAGTYYLYHSGPTGVDCYTSIDLVSWTFGRTVLVGQPGTWAEVELWAPEVQYRRGEFVMYVAATVRRDEVDVARDAGKAHGADGGDDDARRQGVARATDPLGPFVWDSSPLIDEWSIDGHPFVDDDGSEWLFYNVRNELTRHPSGTLGCGNVVDRILDNGLLAGQAVAVALPSLPWEAKHDGSQFWNEGPFTLKRGDRYFQMYSGGWFGGDDYAVGVSVAHSLHGPWTKHRDVPIFGGSEDIKGTGHHSVVIGPDGVSQFAVYHGYVGSGFGRKVHVEPLHWVGDGPQIGSCAARPTRAQTTGHFIPARSAHDPRVMSFHLRAWVRGASDLDGSDLPTGPQPALITAFYDGELMTVRVDGEVVLKRQGAAKPLLVADEILSTRITSHLDDVRHHILAEADHVRWQWGSSLPTDITLAVMGSVVITTADEVREVAAPDEEFHLVQIHAPRGTDYLHVTGTGTRSVVADVRLTARGNPEVRFPSPR